MGRHHMQPAAPGTPPQNRSLTGMSVDVTHIKIIQHRLSNLSDSDRDKIFSEEDLVTWVDSMGGPMSRDPLQKRSRSCPTFTSGPQASDCQAGHLENHELRGLQRGRDGAWG